MVVDWRAPVSTPFYRATAADPLELRRRRRFLMTARQVDDLFDEVFDDPDSVDAAHHGGIPDPLLAELERVAHRRDARHRRHDRGGAGRRDPRAARHLPRRAGRPGHRQDRGRPPPRRVPAVRAPRAARPRRRARRRSEPAVPAVHRPGAPVARRGGHPPDDGRAAGGRTGGPRGPTRGGAPQGRRPHGRRCWSAAARHHLRIPTEDLSVATAWGRLRIPAADLADAVEEIVARDVPFAVGRNAFRTRRAAAGVARAPGLEVAGRRAHRRLRRRDAHQHRAERRRRAHLAVPVGAGPREARAHQPPRPRPAPPTGC